MNNDNKELINTMNFINLMQENLVNKQKGESVRVREVRVSVALATGVLSYSVDFNEQKN